MRVESSGIRGHNSRVGRHINHFHAYTCPIDPYYPNTYLPIYIPIYILPVNLRLKILRNYRDTQKLQEKIPKSLILNFDGKN